MLYRKVEQDTSFVRDMSTNAIVNVNNEALIAYKKRRNAATCLQNDVDCLKRDMQEIKSMLVELLDK